MRSLLLAAALLAPAPLRAAAPPPADWRQAKLTEPMRDALRGAGYALEEDGRVLDPQSRVALSERQLGLALRRLGLSTQRLALERLRLTLEKDPPTPAAKAEIQALKGNLPVDVAQAIDDGAGVKDLRRLTDRDLAQVAAYFDGSRTMAERRSAALPVSASASKPRPPLPYLDETELRLGNALRAAAERTIGRDPYGRRALARLNGRGGRPDLPPILVDDLRGEAARYDYESRALIVDRETLVAAASDGVPPAQRGALAKSLASRAALIAYMNGHPRAVADFAAKNDALLVHELTHAWQDRRDPVMREMARGNLPPAVVLDYEEESWITKNLYLSSKLKHAPASVVNDAEFADARRMMADFDGWRLELMRNYGSAAANAMDFRTLRAIEDHRLEMTRARPADGLKRQTAKALDLLALTRAAREAAATQDGEHARLARLRVLVKDAQTGAPALLARYYWRAAVAATNATEESADLQKAEFYAGKAGDETLLQKIRARREAAR